MKSSCCTVGPNYRLKHGLINSVETCVNCICSVCMRRQASELNEYTPRDPKNRPPNTLSYSTVISQHFLQKVYEMFEKVRACEHVSCHFTSHFDKTAFLRTVHVTQMKCQKRLLTSYHQHFGHRTV